MPRNALGRGLSALIREPEPQQPPQQPQQVPAQFQWGGSSGGDSTGNASQPVAQASLTARRQHQRARVTDSTG